MQITLANEDDKARWLPLWQAYLRFYKQDLSDEVTELTWERFLAPEEPMQLFVARDNDSMCGFVTLVVHRSTWAATHYVYLEDLWVDESARGKGVGKGLISAVVAHARDIAADRVYWVTHSDNTTARALYDRVADLSGFVTYTARM